MRVFVFGAVASLTMFGAALLAAQDFKGHPRDQFTATVSIDTRALTDTAGAMPTQQIDDLI